MILANQQNIDAMTSATLVVGSTQDFFARGKKIARAADHGEKLDKSRIISFETPAALLEFVTERRVQLFLEVKAKSGSIRDLAVRLHRTARSIKADVEAWESVGVLIRQADMSAFSNRRTVHAAVRELHIRCVVS